MTYVHMWLYTVKCINCLVCVGLRQREKGRMQGDEYLACTKPLTDGTAIHSRATRTVRHSCAVRMPYTLRRKPVERKERALTSEQR